MVIKVNVIYKVSNSTLNHHKLCVRSIISRSESMVLVCREMAVI